MRLAVGLVALVLGGAACSTDAPPSTAAATTTPARDRFAPGEELRYRFVWDVESSAVTGLLPNDLPMDASMHLAGELALRVLPPTDEGVLVGISIVALDRHSITLMDQEAMPDASELVGPELFATLADDGEVIALYHPHELPPVALHVLPGLLSQIDLRLPARGASTSRRVATGSGLAEVDYAWSGSSSIARTLRSYARLDAYDAAAHADADGRLEVTLDDRELPLRMEAAEQLSTPSADGGEAPFRSHATFSLERVAIGAARDSTAPVLGELLRRDPNAAPDTDEAERVLAQRFAAGLTEVDVAMAVHAAGAGLAPSAELFVRATGRLRGWPELADELVPLFYRYPQPRARSTITDLLASAGTPEAQAVLCELLADPAVQAEPRHAAWIQRFAFVTQPTPGTARFLLDEHERARTLDDVRPLQAVLYPMGAVARRVAEVDPIASTALRTRLRESLDAARDREVTVGALAGLGNAAASEDLDAVLAHAGDEESEIRAAVANALERQPGERATPTLLWLMLDRDPYVADAALTSVDGRGHDGDSLRLSAITLGGAFVPELSGRLTSALLRRRDDDPWVAVALTAMRSRAVDVLERDRIDATLAGAR